MNLICRYTLSGTMASIDLAMNLALLCLLILLLGLLGVVLLFRRVLAKVKASPEFQAEMAKLKAAYAMEDDIQEQAPWIGQTGLPEEIERELPKYLRREFGESLLEPEHLKAADLQYLGRFAEANQTVHYWRIPSSTTPTFASVSVDATGQFTTSWGEHGPSAAGT